MRPRKHSLRHASSTPNQVSLRLERWHRSAIYAVCVWLLATGVLWLAAHYLMRPVGEFGEGVNPLEPWSMKLHGAGAMAILFFVGSLMNTHIRRALKGRRNLYSGWSMIVMLAILAVSGYGLYYLADEQNRSAWSAIHWIIGLAFPILLILHIMRGRRSVTARLS